MGLILTEQKTELAERMRNDQKNRSKEILGEGKFYAYSTD